MTLNLSKPCSFDLFDTLTTRWYTTPVSIWEEMSALLNDELFVEKRLKAHHADSSSLDNIYQQFQQLYSVSNDYVEQLKWLESRLEINRSSPIRQNINMFKDGDYIISDMYLPEPVVRSIIRRVLGENIRYKLILTPNGKNAGYVWSQVSGKIHQHIGDNLKSDVEQAINHGIVAHHYTGHGYDMFESTTRDELGTQLHMIMRLCRLNNPYEPATDEYNVWNMSSRVVVPLNILYAFLLKNYYNVSRYDKILFLMRDCFFLQKIFKSLFPSLADKCVKFDTSRVMFKNTRPEWVSYATELMTNSVCIDYYASGVSLNKFKQQNNVQNCVFIALCKHGVERFSDQHYFFKDTDSGIHRNKKNMPTNFIELVNNTAPFGCCMDYINNEFIRADSEHPDKCVQVVMRCVDYASILLKRGFNTQVSNPTRSMLSYIDQIDRSWITNWGTIFPHKRNHTDD